MRRGSAGGVGGQHRLERRPRRRTRSGTRPGHPPASGCVALARRRKARCASARVASSGRPSTARAPRGRGCPPRQISGILHGTSCGGSAGSAGGRRSVWRTSPSASPSSIRVPGAVGLACVPSCAPSVCSVLPRRRGRSRPVRLRERTASGDDARPCSRSRRCLVPSGSASRRRCRQIGPRRPERAAEASRRQEGHRCSTSGSPSPPRNSSTPPWDHGTSPSASSSARARVIRRDPDDGVPGTSKVGCAASPVWSIPADTGRTAPTGSPPVIGPNSRLVFVVDETSAVRQPPEASQWSEPPGRRGRGRRRRRVVVVVVVGGRGRRRRGRRRRDGHEVEQRGVRRDAGGLGGTVVVGVPERGDRTVGGGHPVPLAGGGGGDAPGGGPIAEPGPGRRAPVGGVAEGVRSRRPRPGASSPCRSGVTARSATGDGSGAAPVEPRKPASPKAKMPPSRATSQ